MNINSSIFQSLNLCLVPKWITGFFFIFLISVSGCASEPKCEGEDCGDSGGVRERPDVRRDTTSNFEVSSQPDSITETEEDIEPDLPDEPDLQGPCTDGERHCRDLHILEFCDGGLWSSEPCSESSACIGNSCLPVICEPGEPVSCETPTQVRRCDDTGLSYVVEPCPDQLNCSMGVCTDQICTPGLTRCNGPNLAEICSVTGSAWELVEECPVGTICEDEECQDLCTVNSKIATYIGCEYWAADLDNDGRPQQDQWGDIRTDPVTGEPISAAQQQYSVAVSNPNPEISAEVTIINGDGELIELSDPVIPGLGLRVFPLPRRDVNGSGITRNMYHIVSNVPITVHQFNPANNLDVFSNDASLLLPTNALGIDYIVLGWPGNAVNPTNPRSYATIIATQDETTVSVTTPIIINGGTGVTSMSANETREFALDRYQVLNLEMGNGVLDITGMTIQSNKKIAVFFGHECANVSSTTNYCDHMEQQLFPVNSWGTTYVAVKTYPRGAEPDYWRVLASEDNTTVTTNPPQNGAASVTLQRGNFVEFFSSQNFEINSDKPIMVGQYIVGSNYPSIPFSCHSNRSGVGDPAFLLNVPIEQFRKDYIVMIPMNYQSNYFNVIAPPGAVINLDGIPLTGYFVPVGSATFSANRVTSSYGAHILTSDQPFGLTVYGYDCDVSYAYPGGLDLESL